MSQNMQASTCGCQVERSPMDRCSLMKAILEIGFSLDDVILFLDTHPCNEEALCYYHKLHKEYEELVEQYTKNFGPLFAKDVHCDKYFAWANKPMPWEREV